MTCDFVFAFAVLGLPGTAFGDTFLEPGDALKNSAGPSDLQEGFMGFQARFSEIWDAILEGWSLETLFFDTNLTLDSFCRSIVSM